MKPLRGFTLVEILIVVVLLGVLAGIVLPLIAGSAISARESALAHDLQMLRRYILIYKGQHMEIPPGYPDGDKLQAPTEQAFIEQMTLSSSENCQTAPVGTPGFVRGPYLMRPPVNSMNNKATIQVLGNTEDFPAEADDSHGWIYRPLTFELRSDSKGTNESGKRYYDY
jgi:prepilin-type N-terminal cleavage/methylation domain-containing protein